MSDEADLSDLFQNSLFLKLLDLMDHDADEAEKQWKAQVGNPGLADFPAGFLSQYKADGTQLIKTRGAFWLECAKIPFGRGDAKKLLSAHEAYYDSLGLLQESNARFQGIMDAFGASVAAWLLVLLKLAKKFRERELERELKELRAEVAKAIDKRFDAELKRILNLAVSAVTLVIGPEVALAKLAVAAAGITAHIIIDNVFADGGAKGTVAAVAGESGDAIEKLAEASKNFGKAGKKLAEAAKKFGKVGKKAIGGAAAGVMFKFDSDDVEEAQENLDRLLTMFERTRKKIDDFVFGARPLVPQLEALDAGMRACAEEVNKANTRSNNAAKNYDAIKNSIKKAVAP